MFFQLLFILKYTFMKKIFSALLLFTALATTVDGVAQADKSKRPSPPAKATAKLASGGTLTIDYSQPAINGRMIGKEIATYGKIWRTGANEATAFETSKDVTIDGKKLPAGKYSLYTIPGEDEWTIILNKVWNQWGTKYDEAEDVMRFKVTPTESKQFNERMTFNINPEGRVTLAWGNVLVRFGVE
jgi:hypothetical protein